MKCSLAIAMKYRLFGFILDVLTHTTAWNRHWGYIHKAADRVSWHPPILATVVRKPVCSYRYQAALRVLCAHCYLASAHACVPVYCFWMRYMKFLFLKGVKKHHASTVCLSDIFYPNCTSPNVYSLTGSVEKPTYLCTLPLFCFFPIFDHEKYFRGLRNIKDRGVRSFFKLGQQDWNSYQLIAKNGLVNVAIQ